MKGIKAADRAEMAREFLSTAPDVEVAEATAWKVQYCWNIGSFAVAERLLLTEKLKRGLVALTDLRPDQRRALVDPNAVDLHALAAGPIMDAAQLYLPAGKISLSDALARERAGVEKL